MGLWRKLIHSSQRRTSLCLSWQDEWDHLSLTTWVWLAVPRNLVPWASFNALDYSSILQTNCCLLLRARIRWPSQSKNLTPLTALKIFLKASIAKKVLYKVAHWASGHCHPGYLTLLLKLRQGTWLLGIYTQWIMVLCWLCRACQLVKGLEILSILQSKVP